MALIPRTSFLLKIEGKNGIVGVGEATPLPGFSPETTAQCRALCRKIQSNVFELPLDEEPIAALRQSMKFFGDTLDEVPSMQFAFETALLDLLGKHYRKSISTLLNPFSTNSLNINAMVPLSLSDGDFNACLQDFQNRNITTIKLKLGNPFNYLELHNRMNCLRDVMPHVCVRGDANGKWNPNVAIQNMSRCRQEGIAWIEEPVNGHWLLQCRAEKNTWAIDETLSDRLLESAFWKSNPMQRGCAAVVLKPALLGGLIRCKAMAKCAQTEGLSVIVTHMMDGPIAFAACAELALSIENSQICGLDRHAELNLSTFSTTPHWDGNRIHRLQKPGLGVQS